MIKIFVEVKELFHGHNFLFFVKFSMTKQYLKRTSDYVIQYIEMSWDYSYFHFAATYFFTVLCTDGS